MDFSLVLGYGAYYRLGYGLLFYAVSLGVGCALFPLAAAEPAASPRSMQVTIRM